MPFLTIPVFLAMKYIISFKWANRQRLRSKSEALTSFLNEALKCDCFVDFTTSPFREVWLEAKIIHITKNLADHLFTKKNKEFLHIFLPHLSPCPPTPLLSYFFLPLSILTLFSLSLPSLCNGFLQLLFLTVTITGLWLLPWFLACKYSRRVCLRWDDLPFLAFSKVYTA